MYRPGYPVTRRAAQRNYETEAFTLSAYLDRKVTELDQSQIELLRRGSEGGWNLLLPSRGCVVLALHQIQVTHPILTPSDDTTITMVAMNCKTLSTSISVDGERANIYTQTKNTITISTYFSHFMQEPIMARILHFHSNSNMKDRRLKPDNFLPKKDKMSPAGLYPQVTQRCWLKRSPSQK